MKRITIVTLLLLTRVLDAQTITLGPITKTAYCVGDTMLVPYQASGPFKADNFFAAQLSDASGSFVSFTNVGHSVSTSGSFGLLLSTQGSHYRVRVISTSPYEVSSDNSTDISVLSYPSPTVQALRGKERLPYFGKERVFGLIGEPVHFQIGVIQHGDSYTWRFYEDAVPSRSSDSVPAVTYLSEGVKTATVEVTNSAGCSTVQDLTYRIASCTPQIPSNTSVVHGSEGPLGASYVLVKAGANYLAASNQTIFVEAGGALNLNEQQSDIIYLLSGASIDFGGPGGPASFILPSNSAYQNGDFGDLYDTVSCASLSFDYSQLSASVETKTASWFQINQRYTSLSLSTDKRSCSARLFSLLGTELLSQSAATDTGTLDIDLSPLPAGMYFAVIEAGGQREVRKIAVVH